MIEATNRDDCRVARAWEFGASLWRANGPGSRCRNGNGAPGARTSVIERSRLSRSGATHIQPPASDRKDVKVNYYVECGSRALLSEAEGVGVSPPTQFKAAMWILTTRGTGSTGTASFGGIACVENVAPK